MDCARQALTDAAKDNSADPEKFKEVCVCRRGVCVCGWDMLTLRSSRRCVCVCVCRRGVCVGGTC